MIHSSKIHHRECPFCEATCSLLVETDAERDAIVSIKGDPGSPHSKGFVCAKSQGLKGLHADGDRLRRPLQRQGDRFVEIGWAEAFDLAAERLGTIRQAHGRDSIAFYIGNPAGHSTGLMLGIGAMLGEAASRQIYSACSVDVMPRFVVSIFLYGNRGLTPVPDIDRTQFLLIIGANPVVSNGSMLTAPALPRRLNELRARGGRLVVIDPRRSETAEYADTHIAVRPGSDALLLMAIVNTLFAEGLTKPGRLAPLTDGIDEVRRIVGDFTPEGTAPYTGVPSEVVKRLAREFAAAPSAVAYGRVGACCQAFGTLTTWMIDCLNILTGNFDREGGAVLPRAIVPNVFSHAPYVGDVPPYARYRTRVRGAPEVGGEFPTYTLPDEILVSGPGRVRALVTLAGNPVISNVDSGRVREALNALDFMVSVDIYLNETTRFADLILPPVDPLTRADFTFMYAAGMVRPYAQYSPQVFARGPDDRSDFDITMEIGARLARQPRAAFEAAYAQQFAQGFLPLMPRRPHGPAMDALMETLNSGPAEPEPGTEAYERLFDLLVRSGDFGDGFGQYDDGMTLSKLKRSPSGVDFGPMAAERLPGVLATPSGRIQLAPPIICEDVARLRAALHGRRFAADQFRLVGRREPRSNNSWMHNLNVLVKGPARCTARIHPADAEELGLREGDLAIIASKVSSLTVAVVLDEGMMRKVVSLPHGWGHDDPVSRLALAKVKPGVNFNALTDTSDIDVPSGNSVLNGIPVEIRACARDEAHDAA